MFEDMEVFREKLINLKNFSECNNDITRSPDSSGDENVPSTLFNFQRVNTFDQFIPSSSNTQSNLIPNIPFSQFQSYSLSNHSSSCNTPSGSSASSSRDNSPRKHYLPPSKSSKVNDIIKVFNEDDCNPSSPNSSSECDLKTPSSPITSPLPSPNTFDVPCQPFLLLEQHQKLMKDPTLKKSENIPVKEIKPMKKRTKNQMVPRVNRCVCGSTTPGKGPTCKWRKGPSGEVLCNSCGLQNMKKPKCPLCGKMYNKNKDSSTECDSDEWIRCDDCSQWVMTECDGIKDISLYDDTQPNPLHYSCPKCRNRRNKELKKQQKSTANPAPQQQQQQVQIQQSHQTTQQNQQQQQHLYISRSYKQQQPHHSHQTQQQQQQHIQYLTSSPILDSQNNSSNNNNIRLEIVVDNNSSQFLNNECFNSNNLNKCVNSEDSDNEREIREYRERQQRICFVGKQKQKQQQPSFFLHNYTDDVSTFGQSNKKQKHLVER
ncbi:hypothetical protein PPL_06690 [Heterostelium album PN500]|uniref:GATA-type domain-containing protein n=1 Tax=Heterostelium pallidum (strain ATCC 26659 / Pp 5 / PN500) TaxID=670386 RepID=D3BFF6_HETP5|nr:hypothetical protein PPL_06690 [Heterostelium album PN500]EFA79870.1 hypothetical protein PPL_06690 [Heterostelium album PN500]|eukprot:XP_020431991.1 hypothetical protein PPL_06690 [Heterostelium album PN500]